MDELQTRSRALKALLWTLLAVVLIIYGFPFVYLVLTSFKPPIETIAVPPSLFPSTWTLDNFEAALARTGVAGSFLNSLGVACLSTILSLVLAVPAAYAVSRFRTGLGVLFMMAALLARMIPPVAVGVPLLGMLRDTGLLDTPVALALAHSTISLPLSVWLLSSFFEAIPIELEEAAQMDGCNRLQALVKVILPLLTGGLAVTALFAFLASWNEFLFALLLTGTRSQTTPIMIAGFQTQHGLDWGAMAALAVLFSLPVVVLTLMLQRHIVSGLTLGAVKG